MWYFASPQIVFGEGALDALDEIQGQRAMIITDETLVRLGLVDKVCAHLAQAGLELSIFDTVEPDPSLETVLQGAKEALEFAPDWVVGIGGGSVLDAAKAIWILYERPDLQPAEINPIVTLGLRKKARLIAVPTTSGTGSEATWAIVLTDTADQRKMGLGNRENLPDMAIIDPVMAASMPPTLTAETGLDVLTHAVEGYTCAWHNDFADGMCLTAVRLTFEYLPRAFANGKDMEARERMHNAAACAGLGFSNSLTSLAHCMGHTCGAMFHLPHGLAVGMMLPYTVEFLAQEDPSRYAELARLIGCEKTDGLQGARALVERIRSLTRLIGLPGSLQAAGVERSSFEAALDKLVDDAFNDTSMMSAIRTPSFDELTKLFVHAYEGRPVDF